MKGKLLSILIFVLGVSLCEGQSWVWAKQGEIKWTQDLGEGYGVAIDSARDVYFVGYFRDTLSFGAYSITTNQLYGDVYLVKYDSNGNLLWVAAPKTKSNISSSDAWIVSTDADGNAYVTGQIYDTVIFGSFNLYAHYYGVFLTKYDKNGNVVWARQSNGDGYGYAEGAGLSVCTDNTKHEYITGFFSDTLNFGNDTLRTSSNDVFIVKYDLNGNVLWAKQAILNSEKSTGVGYSVANDNMNNIYITGYFQDTLTFGTVPLISTNYAVFVVKYDSSGNVLWAKQCALNSKNSSAYAYAVAADINGNSYITGYFRDTINFGTYTLINDSKYANFFIAKYDKNGNVKWAKAPVVLAPEGWEGYALSVDKAGHLYFTGGTEGYGGGIVFEGDTFSLNDGLDVAVLLEMDTTGSLLCGSILASGGDDASGIASDPTGKYVYIGGDLFSFSDTIFVFGQDTLTTNASTGTEYPFVASWLPCGYVEGINKITSPTSSISLFPNPSPGLFTIQSSVVSGQLSVEIYNILGEKVLTQILRSAQHDNRIDLTGQSNGVYFYRVISEDGNLIGEGKMIIQK